MSRASRASREPPRSRRSVALALGLLAAVGIGGAAYVLREEEPGPEIAEASAPDASTDVRAPAAKAKPGKKPRARGGKTQVAGRTGGGATKARTADGDPHRPPRGPSYESALDGNDEQITMGGAGKGQPDLTDAQLAAPLSDGAFIGECGAPDSMSVTVKVAIRMGRAVGVTTDTSPPSSAIASCIDGHVRALSWPSSAKKDSLVTTY